jgi:hypothetical protein
MSPLTTEGVEELHTVIFAKKKEYSGVIFEGDAQTIVNVVNSLQPYDSSYGHFNEDAKRGLGSLGNSKFVNVKRVANVAAHTLARAACNHATGTILWHCIPSSLFRWCCQEGVLYSSFVTCSV